MVKEVYKQDRCGGKIPSVVLNMLCLITEVN